MQFSEGDRQPAASPLWGGKPYKLGARGKLCVATVQQQTVLIQRQMLIDTFTKIER